MNQRHTFALEVALDAALILAVKHAPKDYETTKLILAMYKITNGSYEFQFVNTVTEFLKANKTKET